MNDYVAKNIKGPILVRETPKPPFYVHFYVILIPVPYMVEALNNSINK